MTDTSKLDWKERETRAGVHPGNATIPIHMEARRPATVTDTPVNQCDGCQIGWPIVRGVHQNPENTFDMIACTADRYQPPATGDGEQERCTHCHGEGFPQCMCYGTEDLEFRQECQSCGHVQQNEDMVAHPPGFALCDRCEAFWNTHVSAAVHEANTTALEDVAAILRTLALGDHARPLSAHHVVQTEILPAITALKDAVEEAVNKLKLDARTLMQGCGFTTIQYEEDDFTLLHAYECGDDHHLCRSCQRRLDALVSAEMLQEKV